MMVGKSYYPQSDFAKEHYGRGMTEGLQEGLREGHQEGLQEGLLQGESRILRRMLQLRFGPLPDALEARLASADSDTLLRWADRVLTAATAEQVFAEG